MGHIHSAGSVLGTAEISVIMVCFHSNWLFLDLCSCSLLVLLQLKRSVLLSHPAFLLMVGHVCIHNLTSAGSRSTVQRLFKPARKMFQTLFWCPRWNYIITLRNYTLVELKALLIGLASGDSGQKKKKKLN